jgi:hypothetical protein
MMMLSCNATTKKTEFSELYPDNYNASIRWKRFDNIKPFLDADDYKALDKIKKKYKDSTINSYKLILIKKISKDKNKVIIEREEVLLPSNTLVTNKYIQYWIYDSKTKTWKIESEVNDLEE